MDDQALFDLAKGSALNAISRAEHVLEVALRAKEPERILKQSLVPHSFDCATQLRTVTIFALRLVKTPMGLDWSLAAKGLAPQNLRQQFEGARAEISALIATDYAGVSGRTVTHVAGDAHLEQTSRDYIVDFAIPNLWFHLSMAYAILRTEGVEIGKSDFDGLHQYEPGFSFV